MPGPFQSIANFLNHRKRDALLASAAAWPLAPAKLLKASVVSRDSLAEPHTSFQDSQVEAAFYFTLEHHTAGNYFGGHLRSLPMSDSEAHRALKLLPEDTPVQVRYNPADPDQSLTLPADNPDFPIAIWPF